MKEKDNKIDVEEELTRLLVNSIGDEIDEDFANLLKDPINYVLKSKPANLSEAESAHLKKVWDKYRNK